MSSASHAKTIVITGASDGIGAAAARRLRAGGHSLVLVGRSPEKTRRIGEELASPYFAADFADLGQVRALASDLASACPTIDVLVNNAGGIFGDRHRTRDGFEKTLQVNHLAPFLLTNLLMPTLRASGASVISTSSVAARLWGRIDIDDLNNDRRFSARKAYGDSKLANILFTKELHRRFHADGLAAAAFHPGPVATGFATGSTSLMRWVYQSPLRHVAGLITPDQGAITLIWLAETTPGADWESGEFYERLQIAGTSPQAADAELARELWDRSSRLVGL
ncbi:Short-chain dehydrogenase [Microbacterium sp. cf046]|uniref:SDR family NAD(P)-dependent oxidoreductase n=1 Tax=Microbacterium sp. cf046 TaxID=1761803 RepID=UPI0008E0FD4F|nr:SDR family NAD(P)-dependent oxidoreductase [Microbacterium sp. cf046]SFR93666.1 Short-chain dehydrogenase [Microbacterium sp. cf046]